MCVPLHAANRACISTSCISVLLRVGCDVVNYKLWSTHHQVRWCLLTPLHTYRKCHPPACTAGKAISGEEHVGLDGEYPEHAAVAVSFEMHAWIRNKQRYLGGTAAYRLASPLHHAVTAASALGENSSAGGQARPSTRHCMQQTMV